MLQRLSFNWKAQTAHGLHSPFVYELYTKVINPIYQENPTNLAEAIIHGLGNHLTLALGKLQVIDLKLAQQVDIDQIDFIMNDQSKLLICLNIRNSKEEMQKWSFIASKDQAIHSIELFELGIITLKPIAPKQHFYLKKS